MKVKSEARQYSNTTRVYSHDYSLNKSKLQRLPNIGQKSLDLSVDSETKVKCLSLLQGIDKLCDSYDQLPIIEFEEDEEPLSQSIIKETPKQQKDPESTLSFIINQLKKRIKNYPNVQAAYPSSTRFKVVSGTGEKVGPGSYKSVCYDQLESHEFSNIPRLYTPIAHTMHTIESLYKRRKEFTNEPIVKKNKLLATNPQQLRDHFTETVNNSKVKEHDAKAKKKVIDLMNKVEKAEKLSEKIRKFEWRMTKEEVALAQKTWAVFVTIIGLRTVISNRTRVKRILRIRWGRVLKRFCYIVKCVGRILIRLKAIRNRLLSKRLAHLFSSMSNYIRNDIIKKKKIIGTIAEKTRDMPVLIHLMAKWKKSITTLQRNIRGMKKINKSRRYVLGLLWDKMVENLQKSKNQEKIHRSLTSDRIYVMPNLIKNKFMKKYK